jgi:hypothetical protein
MLAMYSLMAKHPMAPPDSGAHEAGNSKAFADTRVPVNRVAADYDRTRPLMDERVKPEGLALLSTFHDSPSRPRTGAGS